MKSKEPNVIMEPIIELIWNPEEEDITPNQMVVTCLSPHCGNSGLLPALRCLPPQVAPLAC